MKRNPEVRRRLALALGLTLLGSAACDEGATAPTVDVPSRIVVNPGNVRLTSLSDLAQFSIEVLDEDGRVLQVPVLWWIEGDPVLEETGTAGQFRAIANGSGTLHIAVDEGRAGLSRGRGYSYDVPIAQVAVVVRQEAFAVTLGSEQLDLWSLGEMRVLEPEVTDARGNPIAFLTDSVALSVADPEVAVLDAMGRLVAVADGQSTITARVGGVASDARVRVESAFLVEGCFEVGGTPAECLSTGVTVTERGAGSR